MRKQLHRGMAVILSAAVALSTPLAARPVTAGAESVQLPDPAYIYDFEGDAPLQSTGTQTGEESAIMPEVNGGVVEVVQDGDNHALRVNDGGVKSFGKNYAKLPAGIFKDVTGESGLTVSMRVNIDAEKNLQDASAIFYSTPAKYGEWNLLRTKANLVTGVNAGTPRVWGDTPESKKTKEHFGSWHTVTVTLDKEYVRVYLDGIEQTSTAPTGGDKSNGFVPAIEKFATNQFHALGCGGFPSNGQTSTEDMSEILYDDIKIYTTALSAEQVYSSVTGGDVVQTDKTALAAAIAEAQKLGRFELYTESTAAELKEKLAAAAVVNADPGAEQEAVDAARTELEAAVGNLQRKEINLTSGLLLNTDFTADTSVTSEDKKTVTSGGYAITPMGNAAVSEGSIQSSQDGAGGMAGISLDKDLLLGATLAKGLTFHIKWNFSSIYKDNGADFWDLMAVTGADGNVLLKNTIGFIIAYLNQDTGELTRLYPNPDCKNGFAWDSCKKYETGKVKDLTFTIDSNGCRCYVDGVLACEKKDLSGIDFERIISEASNIIIGRDSEGNHGDLMGSLHGIQVYGRALNEAEVDQLAAAGVPENETTCSVVITARKGSRIELKSGVETVYTVTAGEDGKAVLKGLKRGQEYSYIVANDNYTEVTGTITAGTDTEKDVTGGQTLIEGKHPLTGIRFAETDITLKNVKNTADNSILFGKQKLEVVFEPADTTDDKTLIWSSSDVNVADVDQEGNVTAVSESGEADITAVSAVDSDIKAVCRVRVETEEKNADENDPGNNPGDGQNPGDNQNPGGNQKPGGTQDPGNNQDLSPGGSQASLKLSASKAVLYTGKKKNKTTVRAEVTGSSKSVEWVSSNTKVASVSNGVIRAVKKGTAVITAKANGITQTVRVTVKNPSIKIKKGKKAAGKAAVKRRKTAKFTVSVNPSGSGIKLGGVKGKAKKIAKVTFKNGKLTIKGKKKGKITLKFTSGKAVKKFNVTVK